MPCLYIQHSLNFLDMTHAIDRMPAAMTCAFWQVSRVAIKGRVTSEDLSIGSQSYPECVPGCNCDSCVGRTKAVHFGQLRKEERIGLLPRCQRPL
jgi:hypothetical protein